MVSSGGTGYELCEKRTAETVVFIHGVGLNRHIWKPQIGRFATTHQLLTYDMLGHGDSRQPDDNVTLDSYVAQLENLLNELAIDQINLVGHSMGALVAVAFALAHPQRVRRLIALNIVYQRSPTQRAAVMVRAEKVIATGQIAGKEAALQRWFAGKTDAASQAKIKRVADWLAQVNPVGYGRTYRLFARSDDAFNGRLAQLPMPVLYLTGADDPNSTPAMSHQMASETPRGKAVIIPNEAHMMAYISPEKVNVQLARFLNQ